MTRLIVKRNMLSCAMCAAMGLTLTARAQEVEASGSQLTRRPAGGCASMLADIADQVAAEFDRRQFIFIGSTHGGKKTQDFLHCLLSRPRFQARVTDVLVEWANPVHQKLMDRYLLALEEVPPAVLARVWFDTDAPQLWASMPQMAEFFATVRAINARLEPGKRIRVLGGCEPIDWSAVRTADDIASQPFKNNWASHVISEHFGSQPDRRLLVVYGDAHIHHSGGFMMSALEGQLGRGRLFVVGTISDLSPEEADRVAKLGDPTRPFFVGVERFPTAGPYPRALFYARVGELSRYVDAVVYLGPEPDRDLSKSIALSAKQREELAARDSLRGDARQLMKRRLAQRNLWFRSHPDDLPNRPQ
jgi:hypothetical protein